MISCRKILLIAPFLDNRVGLSCSHCLANRADATKRVPPENREISFVEGHAPSWPRKVPPGGPRSVVAASCFFGGPRSVVAGLPCPGTGVAFRGTAGMQRAVIPGEQKRPRKRFRGLRFFQVVGKTGFEPATPASRTLCSTRLSHFPTQADSIDQTGGGCQPQKGQRTDDR